MAERRHSVEEVDVIEEETTPVLSHKQEHTVAKDAHVTIHGGGYSVKDGKYHWQLKDPKDHDVPLTDPLTSEPSFFAVMVGDYTVRLSTVEGRIEWIFHVTE